MVQKKENDSKPGSQTDAAKSCGLSLTEPVSSPIRQRSEQLFTFGVVRRIADSDYKAHGIKFTSMKSLITWAYHSYLVSL